MKFLRFLEKVFLSSELMKQKQAQKFQSAIRGAPYISPVYNSAKAEPYVTFPVPIKVSLSEIVGVVSVEANLKPLWDLVGEIEFSTAVMPIWSIPVEGLVAFNDRSQVLKGAL